MQYEDSLANRYFRLGQSTLERSSERSENAGAIQVTGFSQRLHKLASPEGRANEKLYGLARSGAGAGAPRNSHKKSELPAAEKPAHGTVKISKESKPPGFSESRILNAISLLSAYLREERERYRPQGRRLTHAEAGVFGQFFSHDLLRQVRVVALSGSRLSNPPFYEKAKALGVSLPDMTHKATATFLDVVVFNEQMTARKLFHALVHAAQANVLGTRFFTELLVRGVLRTGSYSLSPMKAQAFALDARFATNPGQAFSVEDEIRAWMREARY